MFQLDIFLKISFILSQDATYCSSKMPRPHPGTCRSPPLARTLGPHFSFYELPWGVLELEMWFPQLPQSLLSLPQGAVPFSKNASLSVTDDFSVRRMWLFSLLSLKKKKKNHRFALFPSHFHWKHWFSVTGFLGTVPLQNTPSHPVTFTNI